MTLKFVDVELALKRLLEAKGYNAKLYVPDDFEDQVVWIAKIGGNRVGIFDTTQVQISVLDENRERGYTTAEDIFNFLLSDSHFVEEIGLLDRVYSEGSTPLELEFSDQFKNYVFNAAVESRAI